MHHRGKEGDLCYLANLSCTYVNDRFAVSLSKDLAPVNAQRGGWASSLNECVNTSSTNARFQCSIVNMDGCVPWAIKAGRLAWGREGGGCDRFKHCKYVQTFFDSFLFFCRKDSYWYVLCRYVLC